MIPSKARLYYQKAKILVLLSSPLKKELGLDLLILRRKVAEKKVAKWQLAPPTC